MIDPKEELEPGIRENLAIVYGLLLKSLPSVAITGHVCKRDVECVSIEWPRKGLYCYIFQESVTLDKVKFLDGKVEHHQEDLMIEVLKDIFIEKFLLVRES